MNEIFIHVLKSENQNLQNEKWKRYKASQVRVKMQNKIRHCMESM